LLRLPKVWEQRLRLLLLAGVVAPAVMIGIGVLIAWLVRGELLFVMLQRFSWRAVGLGVLTAGLSMSVVYLLSKVSKRLEQALKESGVKVGEEALRVAGYPVMLVVVSAAGIGEEILFRGGLQPTLGVILTALLFGFSHGGWRKDMWAYVIAASISGLIFGLAYALTGDLWVSVIAHTLHNIAATVVLRENDDALEEKPDPPVPIRPERQDWVFHPVFVEDRGVFDAAQAQGPDSVTDAPDGAATGTEPLN
jgi:membrane protease YdiL (CAAX protease family)